MNSKGRRPPNLAGPRHRTISGDDFGTHQLPETYAQVLKGNKSSRQSDNENMSSDLSQGEKLIKMYVTIFINSSYSLTKHSYFYAFNVSGLSPK